MKKIIVHTGRTIEDKCGKQLHPVQEVENVINIIKNLQLEEIYYSNSFDFITAMKYIGKKNNVTIEFYLDSISQGDDIENVCGGFNISLDLINEFGDTE